jgi:L-iditol 2-dehydrogenase
MKSRRALLVSPRHFEIIEDDITAGTEQVLVKVVACGLCNWELNHWKGQLGNCPQTLGHEIAGEIVELGEGVKGLKPGDRVTGLAVILNGFGDYVVFNESDCQKVNQDVELSHALGEPLKCIVTVLKAAAPEFGDYGVVFGCGPMGLWCIQGLSGNLLSGLIAVDIDDEKLALARKFGANFTINPKQNNVEARVREITGGNMADFAIEGTGSPSVVNNALACLKSGRGRLILMSSYESEAAPFNLKMAMEKSIELKVAHPGYSLNQNDDMRCAVSGLNHEIFKMEDIVSHVFKLDEIQKAFEMLENKPAGYLKGVVIP